MVNEKMSDVEQITLLMSLQREMTEMKRRNNEMQRKSEDEILALRRENEEMKRKWVEGGPSVGPGNLAGKSFIHPIGPRNVEEPRGIHTQEIEGESYRNRFVPTTNTLDVSHQLPFTEHIIGAQLPAIWKGFNMDWYDGTTDPNEHMNVYTMHMSLYTWDSAILCRVFPISLNGGALS